ncbi:SMC-Scp complex subunit ScpB [Alkalihalobacillus oceani]|uniref:SMC-Scp complex subunit ScpB n=1 Tax=Halalkalibacter oceani TaxID=1653776 RepID=UPI0020423747|nr:SMC-Scp complex subunit ScpB [Halalkalibacter oceani]MCM3762922.1 SMC-Scp complex subunit ScpB [Halalkalibacter oceani]
MKLEDIQSIMEGLLFVIGDEGLSIEQLADIIELEPETVKEALFALQMKYEEQKRGLQIIEVAGGYRFTTKPEHAGYIKKLAASPLHSGLSQAALETLAIIAYRQPLTRMEIEDVRGVKSEKAIQTLSSKLLIKEVGRAPGAGRPILYGTTAFFLDHFGLNGLEDLPPLPEDVEEQEIAEEADLFFKKFEEELEAGE